MFENVKYHISALNWAKNTNFFLKDRVTLIQINRFNLDTKLFLCNLGLVQLRNGTILNMFANNKSHSNPAILLLSTNVDFKQTIWEKAT